MTAGSLVLIPFRSGTTFSCCVNLSRLEMFVFAASRAFVIPERSSLAVAAVPSIAPHRTANASRPLTLMPRLLVFVKTFEITGNKSCLTVEKSSTGNTTDKVESAASTSECVVDCIAACTTGRTSSLNCCAELLSLII